MFFVIFTAFMCSDSKYNLLKRVKGGSLVLCKMLDFLFLPFLIMGPKITFLQYCETF